MGAGIVLGATLISATAAYAGDGKCGAGKCGGDKATKKSDGKCGAGKCGGDMKKKKKKDGHMTKLKGCGLGLRREFIQEVIPSDFKPDFWEVTPENWIHMPYHHKEAFDEIVLNNKTVAHGLSLSIGGDKRPSKKFLKTIKTFLDKYNIDDYSEHISFSSLMGKQTYELLPLPLTKKMINLLSDRVKYVEDFLGRSLILENATYYYVPDAKMSEVEFINELVHRSGVRLLLDVNNA